MHQAMLWEGERIAGALVSATARAIYAGSENCSEAGQRIGRRVRILVVDDLQVHRQIISTMLTNNHDYADIVTASGGQEACDLLADDPGGFDAVLCDWVMPEVDGLAVLQWMRAHPPSADLPFVMVSGCDDETEILGILGQGVQGFLTKPVNKQVLCRMVMAVLLDRAGEAG
ncbi:MAG: response regulator [Rhodocyclaceae bacterium]